MDGSCQLYGIYGFLLLGSLNIYLTSPLSYSTHFALLIKTQYHIVEQISYEI